MSQVLKEFINSVVKQSLKEEQFKPRFFNGSTIMNINLPVKEPVKVRDGTVEPYDIQIDYDFLKHEHKRQPTDPVEFLVKERGILTWDMNGSDAPEDMEPIKEEKLISKFKVAVDPTTGRIQIEDFKSLRGGDKPTISVMMLVTQGVRLFVDSLKKAKPEKYAGGEELQEFNALSTGNVVGYTGPLGMDTAPIHKAFWSGDKKKKKGAKTASLNNS
jgi:hypothetical protein